MNNQQRLAKKVSILAIFCLVISSFLPLQSSNLNPKREVKAEAINLVSNPSFELDADKYWFLWQKASSTNFSLVRSYETPFGYGSYSASLENSGTPGDRFAAGITGSSLNNFNVTQGKTYYLNFFAKTNTSNKISVFLENVASHQGVVPAQEVALSSDWTKYLIIFTPSTTGPATLAFAFGDLANGSTIYLDGLNLFENNISLAPTTISGYIGDKNKSLKINNGNLLSVNDVKIEIPYFNEETDTASIKQFTPKSISNGTALFDMPAQSFGGLGKVYVSGSLIGEFDYNVLLKITDFNPNPVRADEDLVVYGTGFSPNNEQNFIVIKTVNPQGQAYEKWVKPSIIDDQLSQVVIKVPAGLALGGLSARSYHTNLKNLSIENKSNSLSYKVKPSIYALAWSRKGYEQIGDKVTISGKGIADHPSVNFYDLNGKFISSAQAVVKTINEIENFETIEVSTPKQLSKVKLTVKVGGVESEMADALTYSARPILSTIKSIKSRQMPISNTQIAAAKVGDIIRLSGQGYKSAASVSVEFAGLNGNIVTSVEYDKIDPAGNWLDIKVPDLAQNGQIRVIINDQKSNYLPLEIIPTIISQVPITPTPGEELSFWTSGVGLDKEQTSIHFKLNNNETVTVAPISLEKSTYGNVIVKVMVPKAISSDGSAIKLQYGNWLNDQSYNLTVNPVIERAGIDSDSRILSIKGYGFSNVLSENIITYKYADGTVVTPKVKPLNISNTSEGQEIKIQILDDYTYGYISVTVKNKLSNEYSVGPAQITKIERRVQFVKAENKVMGVLYISGKNFGPRGDVRVADVWAKTHYRSNFFIIAVVDSQNVNKNPIIITKQ